MAIPTRPSIGTQVALVALTLLGLVGGWLILLGGVFHHMDSRFSKETSFVSGYAAYMMSAIFFLMAAIGVAALVQLRYGKAAPYFLGCGLVIGPPIVFILGRVG